MIQYETNWLKTWLSKDLQVIILIVYLESLLNVYYVQNINIFLVIFMKIHNTRLHITGN